MGAAGAGEAFVEKLNNLYDVLEGILALDGAKPRVSMIRLTVQAKSESFFALLPVIIQTAGTITDTVDIDVDQIEDKSINPCIDDVFGYKNLSNFFKTSRRAPSEDSTAATGLEYVCQFSTMIPGNFIQILNKETETERLQDLYQVLYGFCSENNQAVYIKETTEVLFTTVTRNITIR
jgi:hypothetical protein